MSLIQGRPEAHRPRLLRLRDRHHRRAIRLPTHEIGIHHPRSRDRVSHLRPNRLLVALQHPRCSTRDLPLGTHFQALCRRGVDPPTPDNVYM